MGPPGLGWVDCIAIGIVSYSYSRLSISNKLQPTTCYLPLFYFHPVYVRMRIWLEYASYGLKFQPVLPEPKKRKLLSVIFVSN